MRRGAQIQRRGTELFRVAATRDVALLEDRMVEEKMTAPKDNVVQDGELDGHIARERETDNKFSLSIIL